MNDLTKICSKNCSDRCCLVVAHNNSIYYTQGSYGGMFHIVKANMTGISIDSEKLFEVVFIMFYLQLVRYLRGRIKAGTHGLSAVERAYGRLWSMADRTWQIEHRGEFRLALRRATSLPRGNKRDYVSYKTLVRWRFACALRGSARGFWFIDPLGRLCTVATRACHVNHAPPSYIVILCMPIT